MLTDCLTVDIDSALASVNRWLRDYVTRPHDELGRSGAICPFVEASQRTESLEVRVRLVGPAPSTPLLVESLRCALDEFGTMEWRGSNPNLWALVVVFPDLPEDRFELLDEAHALIKTETVHRGLMIGQFHDRCDERAARNPDFRVSRSPVPLVAIRRMAVHDVLFLQDRRDWFEEYVTHFGPRYETDGRGLDAQYVTLYAEARAGYGMPALGEEPAGERSATTAPAPPLDAPPPQARGDAAPNGVARGGDRAELDGQFSPSHLVPSLQAYLQEYAQLSSAVHSAHTVRTGLRYGQAPEETLDFFPACDPGATPTAAPLQVFVHGGNWQALTKDDSAFPAPGFLAAGAAFATVNYGLAPDHPLDDIVTMVRRAVRWLHANAGELGFDPNRIHLSGTSAGAHLVAMALVDDAGSEATDGAADRTGHESGVCGLVAGAALLSGIYDLEPVRHSYVNDALHLDEAAARRNSPVRLPLATRTGAPLVVARGGIETGEYVRQHAEMVAAMQRQMPVVEIVSPQRNHFDVPYELADPGTELGAAVLRQMGLRTWAATA